MQILLYSPDEEHVEALAEALRNSGDDKIEVVRRLERLTERAASLEELGGVIIAYDDPGLLDVIDNVLECHSGARIVLLMPMARIPSLIGCRPNTTVLPLPGTGLALRVALSQDPAKDASCRIGDFQLFELSALGARTHVFKAMQVSIERPVTLHMINDEWFDVDHVRESFLEDVRAKAMVTHEDIASVYQALETNGHLFYTEEALNGGSLAELAVSGGKIEALRALQVVRTVAGTLAHLKNRGLGCHGISLRHVFLPDGVGQHPRIANQADARPLEEGGFERLFKEFIEELWQVVDQGSFGASETYDWFVELQSGQESLDNIVRDARMRLAMVEGGGGGSAVRPRIHVSGQRMKMGRKGRKVVVMTAVVVGILLVYGVFLRPGNSNSPSEPPAISLIEGEMVPISAGTFEHPEGGTVELEPFLIGEYEVTIAQYAEFLEAIGEDGEAGFRHPDQPEEKVSHEPENWDAMYDAALYKKPYMGQVISLNVPVFNVDWWDAYAYAEWRGHRLPTSMEWELAARGSEWHLYPWGGEWDPARLNSGDDLPTSDNEIEPGAIDGYVYWGPVDQPEGDISPSGVRGMGGNVAEWTASEAVHPSDPNRTVAVVKGGSFSTGEAFDMGKARQIPRDERRIDIGFRTASSQMPSEQ